MILIAIGCKITAKALGEHIGGIIASNVEEMMRALDSGEVTIFIVESEGLWGFTGEELMKTAKHIKSDTKVIVLTTDAKKEGRKKCYDACFEKPFDFDEFHEKLKEFHWI